MKKLFSCAVSAISLLAGTVGAQAADEGFQAGDIMLRLRGLAVLPDVSSKVTPIGGSVDITDAYIPELDATYFVTENFGIEAIAGTSRHGVKDKHSVAGDIDLGSVWLLPPTVTAQWHFAPKSAFNPYLGAGVNYTFFYNVTRSSAIQSIKYDDNFGYDLQAGFDYNVSDRWYLNVDVKKLFLDTKVKINGGPISAKVDIDPWIVGVGVGYRF